MKKTILITFCISIAALAHATKITVAINGFTYTPAAVSAKVGDTVVLPGNSSHPLIQISSASYAASSTTVLPGGFGPLQKDTTLIVSNTDSIFFMCSFHGASGMKGFIAVMPTSGLRFSIQNEGLRYTNPSASDFLIKNLNSTAIGLHVYDWNGKFVAIENLKQGENRLLLYNGMYVLYFYKGEELLGTEKLLIANP